MWYTSEDTAVISLPSYKNGAPTRVHLALSDDISKRLYDEFMQFIESDPNRSEKVTVQCVQGVGEYLRMQLFNTGHGTFL